MPMRKACAYLEGETPLFTELPVNGVLGNSVGYKEVGSNLDSAWFEQRGCQTYDGIEKIRC